ncbi:MAG: hypothetical protein AUI18_10085 [Candidatus Rokubacteria bacterium 13_1_40CM_2_70_45]|nr:MAG: hypothetical protein AUI18_10085 [Candidatus Rokubacteria bacterium 13_1_40CM_2_70_45]
MPVARAPLRTMSDDAPPRRTLAAACAPRRRRTRPAKGRLLATEPPLADRLAKLETVESPAELTARATVPEVR